jgi:predicted transcriptional regulator
METRTITLSIPNEIMRKVKLLAVRRDTSVSRLLSQTLERLVEQEDAYARARQRHLRLLDQSVNLGTEGRTAAKRDELHERV